MTHECSAHVVYCLLPSLKLFSQAHVLSGRGEFITSFTNENLVRPRQGVNKSSLTKWPYLQDKASKGTHSLNHFQFLCDVFWTQCYFFQRFLWKACTSTHSLKRRGLTFDTVFQA